MLLLRRYERRPDRLQVPGRALRAASSRPEADGLSDCLVYGVPERTSK